MPACLTLYRVSSVVSQLAPLKLFNAGDMLKMVVKAFATKHDGSSFTYMTRTTPTKTTIRKRTAMRMAPVTISVCPSFT